MEDSPAKTNTKLLMDIQYSIKELTTSVTALKYELAYIKSNLHFKPVNSPVIEDIEEEVPESIKNWWWSA